RLPGHRRLWRRRLRWQELRLQRLLRHLIHQSDSIRGRRVIPSPPFHFRPAESRAIMPPVSAILWLALLPTAPPDDARIDSLVGEAMRAWNVPGVAVVIVTPNRVVYLKGHGVRELGRKDPVTPDTLFPLASCSKAFTTALVGALVDDD